MIETTCRALLVLTLAVAAMPAQLWAQQEGDPADTTSSGEAVSSAQETPSERDTPASANDNDNATGEDRPSPFDYEASEKISEDLSVSFPVDI